MTDVLFERFAALADQADDSDWLDVRRRARRPRSRIAATAAAAAALVAVATALATGGGWIFRAHDHQVTAATSVTLNRKTWRVSITNGTFGRVCVSIAGQRTTCTSRLGQLGRARPFGAISATVAGGQIWVGATVGFARRIAITNAGGQVYSTKTIAAPKGTKTPFRYWALAVAGSATSVTAYDARGRSIWKTLR